VRICARGELIKTHERKPSGGRSTDSTDYPDDRVPYARRWPNYYCKRARELGPAAGDFTEKLLSGEFSWSRLRQAQKLLRLAERYGAARSGGRLPAGSRVRLAGCLPRSAHSRTGAGIANRTAAHRRTAIQARFEVPPPRPTSFRKKGIPMPIQLELKTVLKRLKLSGILATCPTAMPMLAKKNSTKRSSWN
jgi:hypothetical protein